MATLTGDKTFAAVCLSLLVLATEGRSYDVKDGRHNITMGHRLGRPPYNDFLIVHDNPELKSSWFRVQSHDVCYPRPGFDTNRKFSITAFNVTDRVPAGEGGYAFVTKGGVNTGKLCLHLKTQRGNGYNFSIDIWGYYI
ncbi:probable salivary secreted peptide [Macrosteles quadrilineatus]|uniref:probable salivary secreted peptide n=1 Tax=Macrosteles quadrilineatus TaxID=74068 RepID=UPI0023E1F319|nr:probable salivary secreted peptide [Macrosteles quadrilineatus]